MKSIKYFENSCALLLQKWKKMIIFAPIKINNVVKSMKDNSWQSFMNKGQGGQKGQAGNGKGAANTKGNGASAKQMNRRTQ